MEGDKTVVINDEYYKDDAGAFVETNEKVIIKNFQVAIDILECLPEIKNIEINLSPSKPEKNKRKEFLKLLIKSTEQSLETAKIDGISFNEFYGLFGSIFCPIFNANPFPIPFCPQFKKVKKLIWGIGNFGHFQKLSDSFPNLETLIVSTIREPATLKASHLDGLKQLKTLTLDNVCDSFCKKPLTGLGIVSIPSVTKFHINCFNVAYKIRHDEIPLRLKNLIDFDIKGAPGLGFDEKDKMMKYLRGESK